MIYWSWFWLVDWRWCWSRCWLIGFSGWFVCWFIWVLSFTREGYVSYISTISIHAISYCLNTAIGKSNMVGSLGVSTGTAFLLSIIILCVIVLNKPFVAVSCWSSIFNWCVDRGWGWGSFSFNWRWGSWGSFIASCCFLYFNWGYWSCWSN